MRGFSGLQHQRLQQQQQHHTECQRLAASFNRRSQALECACIGLYAQLRPHVPHVSNTCIADSLLVIGTVKCRQRPPAPFCSMSLLCQLLLLRISAASAASAAADCTGASAAADCWCCLSAGLSHILGSISWLPPMRWLVTQLLARALAETAAMVRTAGICGTVHTPAPELRCEVCSCSCLQHSPASCCIQTPGVVVCRTQQHTHTRVLAHVQAATFEY